MDEVKKQLDTAQYTANAAEEKLALERQRVEKVQQELQALDEQLRLADPDDEKAFGRIVGSQAAARARAEALQARVAEAERSSEIAQADLAVAKRAAAHAELRGLAAKRQAVREAIIVLVRNFAADFAAQLQAHTDLAHSEATRALERAAGGSLAETSLDRQSAQDLPRALASILAELHHLELAEKERVFRATPEGIEKTRREDEARRLEQERTAQRMREINFEGNLGHGQPAHVRAATFGGDHADT